MLDHEPARERHTLRIEDRRFDRPGRRRGGTRSALPLMGRGVVLDDAVVVVQPLGVTRQTPPRLSANLLRSLTRTRGPVGSPVRVEARHTGFARYKSVFRVAADTGRRIRVDGRDSNGKQSDDCESGGRGGPIPAASGSEAGRRRGRFYEETKGFRE
ncbi:hypothetical protein BHM03_00004047 [Ensete ventricosum]|nr:hypothetical protein BHM03_00004047 [Ensete ventricosum]